MIIRYLLGVVFVHNILANNVYYRPFPNHMYYPYARGPSHQTTLINPVQDQQAASECKTDVALQVLEQLLEYISNRPHLLPLPQTDSQSVSSKLQILTNDCSTNPITCNLFNKWNGIIAKNALVLNIDSDIGHLDFQSNAQNVDGKDKIFLTYEVLLNDESHCKDKLLRLLPSANTVREILVWKDVCAKRPVFITTLTPVIAPPNNSDLIRIYTTKLQDVLLKFLETRQVPRPVALNLVLHRPVEEIMTLMLQAYKNGIEHHELQKFVPGPNDFDALHEVIIHLPPIEGNLKLVTELNGIFPGLLEILQLRPRIPITEYKLHNDIYMLVSQFLRLHQIPNENIKKFIESKSTHEILDFIVQKFTNSNKSWKFVEDFQVLPADRQIIDEFLMLLRRVPAYNTYIVLLEDRLKCFPFTVPPTPALKPTPTLKPKLMNGEARDVLHFLIKLLNYHKVVPHKILSLLLEHSFKDVLNHIHQAFKHEDDILTDFVVLPNDFELITNLWLHIPKRDDYLVILKRFDQLLFGIYDTVMQQNTFDNRKVLEFENYIALYRLLSRFLQIHKVPSHQILDSILQYKPKHLINLIVAAFLKDEKSVNLLPRFTVLPDDKNILNQIVLLIPKLPAISFDTNLIKELIEKIENKSLIPLPTPNSFVTAKQPVHLYTGEMVTALLYFLRIHNVPPHITLELFLNRTMEDVLKIIFEVYQTQSGNNYIPEFIIHPDDFELLIEILAHMAPTNNNFEIIKGFDDIFPNLLQAVIERQAKLNFKDYDMHRKIIEVYRSVLRFFLRHEAINRKTLTFIEKHNILQILEFIIQVLKHPYNSTELIPKFHVIPEDINILNDIVMILPHVPLYEQFTLIIKDILKDLPIVDNVITTPKLIPTLPQNHLHNLYTRDLFTVLLKFLDDHRVPRKEAFDLILKKSVSEILALILHVYRTRQNNDLLLGFTPLPNDFEHLILLLKHFPPSPNNIQIVKEFDVLFPGLNGKIVLPNLDITEYNNSIHIIEVYRLIIRFLYNHGIPDVRIIPFIQNNTIPQILNFMVFLIKHPHSAMALIPNFYVVPEDRDMIIEIQLHLPNLPLYDSYRDQLKIIAEALSNHFVQTTELPKQTLENKYTRDLITVLMSFLIDHNVPHDTALDLLLNKSVPELLTLIKETYQNSVHNNIIGFKPLPNDLERLMVVINHLPPLEQIWKQVEQFAVVFPEIIKNVNMPTVFNLNEYEMNLKLLEVHKLFMRFLHNHGVPNTEILTFIGKNNLPQMLDFMLFMLNEPLAGSLLIPGFHIIPEDKDVITGILMNLHKLTIYDNHIILLKNAFNRIKFLYRSPVLNHLDLLFHLIKFLQDHNISSDKIVNLLYKYSMHDILALIFKAYEGKKEDILITFSTKPNDFEFVLQLLSRLPTTDNYLAIFKDYDQLFPGIYKTVINKHYLDNGQVLDLDKFLEFYKAYIHFLQSHHVPHDRILKLVLEHAPKQVFEFITSIFSSAQNGPSVIPGFTILPEDKDILNQMLILMPEQSDIIPAHKEFIQGIINSFENIYLKLHILEWPVIKQKPYISVKAEKPIKIHAQDIISALVRFLVLHKVPVDISHKLVLNKSSEELLKLILNFYKNGPGISEIVGFTPQSEDFKELTDILLHVPKSEEILKIIEQFDVLFPGLQKLVVVPILNKQEVIRNQKLIEINRLVAQFLYLHGMPYTDILKFLERHVGLESLNFIIDFNKNPLNFSINVSEFKPLPGDLDILHIILKYLANDTELSRYRRPITDTIIYIQKEMQEKIIPPLKPVPDTEINNDIKYVLMKYLKLHHVPVKVIMKLLQIYSVEEILQILVERYEVENHKGILDGFTPRSDDFELLLDLLTLLPQTNKVLIVINNLNSMFPGLYNQVQNRIRDTKPAFLVEITNKVSQILGNHGMSIQEILKLFNKYNDSEIIMLLMDIFQFPEKFRDTMPNFKPTRNDLNLIADIYNIINTVPGAEHNVQKLSTLIQELKEVLYNPANVSNLSPELDIKYILEKFLLNHSVSQSEIDKLFNTYTVDKVLNMILSAVESSNNGLPTLDLLPNFTPQVTDAHLFFDIINKLAYDSYVKFKPLILKIRQAYPKITEIEPRKQNFSKNEMRSIVKLILNFLQSYNVPQNEIIGILNKKTIAETLNDVSVVLNDILNNPFVQKHIVQLERFINDLKILLEKHPKYYNIIFGNENSAFINQIVNIPRLDNIYGGNNYHHGISSEANLNKLNFYNNGVIAPRFVNYISKRSPDTISNYQPLHHKLPRLTDIKRKVILL
ncbi:hypothetical protein K1T71_013789 [Dendrolimus kikuchii]|uniref:Uncharacterized protein n=1 Tax=Dendrolimus kikuchii TaxID=765133 RepID=A0ACC1CFQ8_9NEOP|nr:hypothetical protein K1T71_013789 [Dendrolimus kikuchii]